jgi:hypothetical protein
VQTGGTLAVGGNLTVSNDFSQGTSGSITVAGNTSITDTTGGVNIGNLNTTGTTQITSTGGNLDQAAGTSLVSGGTTTLNASNAGLPANITLINSTNDFTGAVSASGADVALTDANAMALGTVTTTGQLTLNSTGALNLGTSTVGGNLSANSGNGNITQIGALIVVDGSVLNVGTGSLLLNNAGNIIANGVTVTAANSSIVGDTVGDAAAAAAAAAKAAADKAAADKAAADKAAADKAAQDAVSQNASKTGQGQVVTALDNAAMPAPLALNTVVSSNVAVSSATNTTNSSSTGSANSSAASGSNSAGVTVDLLSASSASAIMMAAVSLPKGSSTVGVGFSFALPEAVQALAQQGSQTVDPQPSLPDGSPLPAWLRFDVSTLRFEAQAVPTGAFPLQVLLNVAGSRVMVVISERVE